MTYSMQIKLKDDSLLPFVDSVFAEQGFKKEVKPDGELEYIAQGEKPYAKMHIALSELDGEPCMKKFTKLWWVEDNSSYEDILEERKGYYAQKD